MNEALKLLMAGLAGAGLGAIFFGGLWWTVRKGLSSNHPASWFLGSLLLRTAIAVVGFYFVGSYHLERLAACLLGFVIARLVVTQMTRAAAESQTRPVQKAGHAH